MRNEVYREADELSLPVGAGVKSGDPVMVGALPGVAATDADADGNATVWMHGAYRIPVTTTTALAVGDPVYFVTSSGALSTTDNTGANALFGYALTEKGTTAGETVVVKIAKV